MPVETPHELYKDNIDNWSRCRTISKGQRFVKAEGKEFLPALGGQSQTMYKSYLLRAYFFNATGRTIEGLVGVVFRKQAQVEFPESKKDFLKAVGKEGSPFESFARSVFRNVVIVGRHGVLLDAEDSLQQGIVNPYFVGYNAEAILNWRVTLVLGEYRLSLVVLEEESASFIGDDRFVEKHKKQIRVLTLKTPNFIDEEGFGGVSLGEDMEFIRSEEPVYVVEIWEENPNKTGVQQEKFILVELIIPKIRGKHLNYIPFVFMGPIEASSLVQRPMIEDLCDVNISHYLTSADLEHGRHFTALPTAWVAGFKTDEILAIGSQTAWVSEDPNANAGFLEYTGQGLQALENAIKSKEEQMAILGARLLEVSRKAVESADTHKQRQAGEASILGSAAASVEDGFTQLLKWTAEWLGAATTNVSVTLNKDYLPKTMDPQMLTALTLALQSNNISWDTYIHNLALGEILPEGRTAEEELAFIEARAGTLPSSMEEEDGVEEEDDLEEDDLDQ